MGEPLKEGRKPKVTKDQTKGWTMERKWENFLKEYTRNRYDTEATCKSIGMSVQTFQRWLKEPEFQQALEQTQKGIVHRLFERGAGLALDGDPAMIRHYQGALDSRFTKKTKLEVSGRVEHQHTKALGGMSERDKFLELKRIYGEEKVQQLFPEALEADYTEVDGD